MNFNPPPAASPATEVASYQRKMKIRKEEENENRKY